MPCGADDRSERAVQRRGEAGAVLEIFEGANELQQWIVARYLLAALSIVAARLCHWRRHGQQCPAASQILSPVAIAEKPVMADALEAVWKDMHQETPQEFVGGQGHHFLLVLVLIVLVSETDLSIFQLLQSVIGDRDPMCVASQIIQNFFGTTERRFGMDYPSTVTERRQISSEAVGIGPPL